MASKATMAGGRVLDQVFMLRAGLCIFDLIARTATEMNFFLGEQISY